jgi:hypothetical protein
VARATAKRIAPGSSDREADRAWPKATSSSRGQGPQQQTPFTQAPFMLQLRAQSRGQKFTSQGGGAPGSHTQLPEPVVTEVLDMALELLLALLLEPVVLFELLVVLPVEVVVEAPVVVPLALLFDIVDEEVALPVLVVVAVLEGPF